MILTANTRKPRSKQWKTLTIFLITSKKERERTMEKKDLEQKLKEWTEKVLKTYGSEADTYRMVKDIDKILADAFQHDTIIQ